MVDNELRRLMDDRVEVAKNVNLPSREVVKICRLLFKAVEETGISLRDVLGVATLVMVVVNLIVMVVLK